MSVEAQPVSSAAHRLATTFPVGPAQASDVAQTSFTAANVYGPHGRSPGLPLGARSVHESLPK